MTCRPDPRALIAFLALLLAVLPAQAAPEPDALPLARDALRRGDGIAAEIHAREALKSGVDRAEVAPLLGQAEMLQGNLAAARGWLDPAGFSPGSAAEGFHALARLEMAEGNFAPAAEAFDRALALNPDNAALWADIGSMRYRAGEHLLALEAADRAVALGPADPAALSFKALLLRDSAGPAAALPLLKQALEAASDDLVLLGHYAATLGEIGRNREMLAVARRMVEIDPRHPQAYYLQAVLAARAGQTGLARRLLLKCQGTCDETPAGAMLAGVLEFRAGNMGAAVDRFDALSHRQPDNALARLLLGRALVATGEANELVARLGAAADRPAAGPYLLTLVGRAYERLGRRERATAYLDRAARWQPPALALLPGAGTSATLPLRPEAVAEAGEAIPAVRGLLARGRTAEAQALARGLRRRFPGSADYAQLAGDVELFARRPQAALEDYATVAQVRRSLPLAYRMAAALNALDRPDDARRLLAGIQASRPVDRQLAGALGLIAAERGEWQRSRALLAHATGSGAGRADTWMLAALARAEHALGDADAAQASALRALTWQPANRRLAALSAGTGAAGQAGGVLARTLTVTGAHGNASH